MRAACKAVTVSVNGWTVTVPNLAQPEQSWLEQRLKKAQTIEEARAAAEMLRPEKGEADGRVLEQ